MTLYLQVVVPKDIIYASISSSTSDANDDASQQLMPTTTTATILGEMTSFRIELDTARSLENLLSINFNSSNGGGDGGEQSSTTTLATAGSDERNSAEIDSPAADISSSDSFIPLAIRLDSADDNTTTNATAAAAAVVAMVTETSHCRSVMQLQHLYTAEGRFDVTLRIASSSLEEQSSSRTTTVLVQQRLHNLTLDCPQVVAVNATFSCAVRIEVDSMFMQASWHIDYSDGDDGEETDDDEVSEELLGLDGNDDDSVGVVTTLSGAMLQQAGTHSVVVTAWNDVSRLEERMDVLAQVAVAQLTLTLASDDDDDQLYVGAVIQLVAALGAGSNAYFSWYHATLAVQRVPTSSSLPRAAGDVAAVETVQYQLPATTVVIGEHNFTVCARNEVSHVCRSLQVFIHPSPHRQSDVNALPSNDDGDVDGYEPIGGLQVLCTFMQY